MTEMKTPEAPVAKHERLEGDNRIQAPKKGKETVKASIPEFRSNFDISTTNARIQVQSEAAYWRSRSADYASVVSERGDLVRLTDDSEAHILLSPAEALSVAAALQAVAVRLLEQRTLEAVVA